MRVPLTEISIICSINVIHSSLCHHTQNEKVLIDQHPYLNWLGQPSRKLSVAVSIASFKLLLAASHPPLPWYSAGAVEPAGAGAGAGAGARESKNRPLKTSAASDVVASNGREKLQAQLTDAHTIRGKRIC